MKQIQAILFCLILLSFSSCDDGRIYPAEEAEEGGGKGSMKVRFHGEGAWPQEYMLVFAAFGDDNGIPVISKVIPKPDHSDTPVEMTLNGLDERTKRLSVAVVNKGRELIYDFYSYPVDDASKEILLPVTEINLAGYDRIQKQVFDAYCIRCHGAGENAAAGLNLMGGHSYESLVNIKSVLSKDDKLLVNPGQTGRSFLYDVLKEDIINYNHTDVLPESELIELISAWITNGAEK